MDTKKNEYPNNQEFVTNVTNVVSPANILENIQGLKEDDEMNGDDEYHFPEQGGINVHKPDLL